MPPVEAPSVAADQAAPATPAAPAAAPAAPSTPPAEGRGNRLFSLLAAEMEVPPGKKPEKKSEPAAAPAAPATPAATPAATPSADDKPIKATRKAPISKRPELPTTPVAAAQVSPVAATPAKDDSDWETQLVDEEKQLIEDAKEAEKHLPTRKGLTEQAKKFVKANQQYLEKHPEIENDPDEKSAYEVWLKKNRPSLSESEQRTVSENRIAARVARPFEEKTEKLEHELFVRDQEPVIRQQREKVASEINSAAIPQEIMEFAQKYGVDTARKEFADELKVVNTIVSAATGDYEELIRLATVNPNNGRPLATPATNQSDPKFPQHERLGVIIDKVNDDFKANAKEKELLRDGKWFVTRAEWNSLPASARNQYWTFTNREIATRSLEWVKPAVAGAIKQNQESLAARGYERRKFVPPAAPAAPAVPPQPTRSASGPSPSPVPSSTPNSGKPPTVGSRLLGALTQD